jgi:hypothetical protein
MNNAARATTILDFEFNILPVTGGISDYGGVCSDFKSVVSNVKTVIGEIPIGTGNFNAPRINVQADKIFEEDDSRQQYAQTLPATLTCRRSCPKNGSTLCGVEVSESAWDGP